MAENKTLGDFEASLKELDNIVAQMQAGQLRLDESMKCFEKGIKLIRDCQSTLTQAEQKVEILTSKNELKNFKDNPDD